MPVVLPLLVIAVAAGITRPTFVAYYGALGMAVSDVDASATDRGVYMLTQLALLVGFATLAILGVLVGHRSRGRLSHLRLLRARAGRMPLLPVALMVVVTLGFFAAFELVTGSSAIDWLLIMAATWLFGFAMGFLLGELSPTPLWIPFVFCLATAVYLVFDTWASGAHVAQAIRRGEARPAVLFEYQDTRVQLQPVGVDSLHLCERPARAWLVGRGRGNAYLVIRDRSLAVGKDAPVVPVPETLYVAYAISHTTPEDAPLCARILDGARETPGPSSR